MPGMEGMGWFLSPSCTKMGKMKCAGDRKLSRTPAQFKHRSTSTSTGGVHEKGQAVGGRRQGQHMQRRTCMRCFGAPVRLLPVEL